jgi:chromosome partitioning protein
MPTTIFSIANQKGGVGKTTTAIHLAAALAEKGIPTLLIDLDPQANATSALGLEKEEGASIYGVLHGDENILEKVAPTGRKHFSIIRSELDLAAIEVELGRREAYLSVLKDAVKPLVDSGKFRVIVIDAPPSLGMLSMNALAAADYLIITLQCEYLAMEGLGQILKVLQDIRQSGANARLELGGIVMTMYDLRTNLARQVVEEVTTHLGEKRFQSLIPRTIRLGEAPSFGKTLFEYDPENPACSAFRSLAREFIERFALKDTRQPTVPPAPPTTTQTSPNNS